MALRHALISYLFGAVIIGLVINVVASLLRWTRKSRSKSEL
jgi:uncharacterized membrane protein